MARYLVCLLAVFLVANVSGEKSVYKDLYDYVTKNSNPLYIPSKTLPVVVTAQAGVVGIHSVDREKNEVDSSHWVLMSWNSDLKWKPSDFNGIATISLPMHKVWRPDMNLYNADSTFEFIVEPLVNIFPHGLHLAFAYVRSTVHCKNLAEDTCSYKFASWGQNQNIIQLKDPSERLYDMNEILKDWKLDNTNYEVFPGSYEKSTFSIHEILPDVADMVEYTFTFKEKNPQRKGPFRALFQWG